MTTTPSAAPPAKMREIDTITFTRGTWEAFEYWYYRDAENDNVTDSLSNAWHELEAVAPPALPASQPPAVQGVPAGWKLVPIEPTERMVHAGEDVEPPRPFGKVYRAMIAAAPQLGEQND